VRLARARPWTHAATPLFTAVGPSFISPAVFHWRPTLARDRRSPAGFIRACQPVLAQKVPTGPEWIHELKWDGWRILARRESGRVCLWSRHGRNWTDAFPSIVAAVQRLEVDDVVIDGEAVCLLPDGRPDFHALQSKRACQDARLIAFDLLALTSGEDLRRLPLQDRRRRLESLLAGRDDALWFSSHVKGADGEALFHHACAMNLEGIVSKRNVVCIVPSLRGTGPRSSARSSHLVRRDPARPLHNRPHAM
jgi:bifunctional non-homologous end joining protein LigD